MKGIFALGVLIVIAVVGFIFVGAKSSEGEVMNKEPLKERSIYEFTMKDIDGNDVKLEKYRGKAVLIVNVASECGYTPQYKGLQATYDKYKDQNFVILGFPANEFGGQEPGSNAEIKQFCEKRFKVSFPMFSKIVVKGGEKHPLYRFLTEPTTDPKFAGDIKWNFNKFLISKEGEILARFDSGDEPEGSKVTSAIEAAIK